MSRLSLTLKHPLKQRLDMRPLTAEEMANGAKAVADTMLCLQGEKVPLGDLFTVTGTPLKGEAEDRLILFGSSDKLDGLGANWGGGTFLIEGDCGTDLGEKMRGGRIEVRGNAGSGVARGMQNGRIDLSGNAGDGVGAPLLGERAGMKGGIVCIQGRAGDRVGERMRRGLILVAGRVGTHCAARLIAGTIGVVGPVGAGFGLGMRRGTVILARKPATLPATFNDSGVHDLAFFRLLISHLRRFGKPFFALSGRGQSRYGGRGGGGPQGGGPREGGRFHKYVGDIGVGGQGEVLIPDFS